LQSLRAETTLDDLRIVVSKIARFRPEIATLPYRRYRVDLLRAGLLTNGIPHTGV